MNEKYLIVVSSLLITDGGCGTKKEGVSAPTAEDGLHNQQRKKFPNSDKKHQQKLTRYPEPYFDTQTHNTQMPHEIIIINSNQINRKTSAG